jgi:hypothetical protein
VSYTTIWTSLFADDSSVFALSEEELQQIMHIFNEVCREFGQEVSFKKTEVMVVKPRHGAEARSPTVTLKAGDVDENGQPRYLNVVKNVRYLGSQEDNLAGIDMELNIRRQRTAAALSKNSKAVFENPKIRLRTKILMYKTTGQTSLLYGCACWTTTQQQFAKLESVQIQHLRRCMGFRWNDRVTYLEMLAQTAKYKAEVLPVEAVVRERRLLFVGRVERMGPTRVPYQILHGEVVGGKRSRGKSERQYRHCIKEDLRKFGIPENEWQQIALDAAKWKTAVTAGLKIFLRDWTEHRIAERQKVKIAEQRRRLLARGAPEEVSSPPKAIRRTFARASIESTIRRLDERQQMIPAHELNNRLETAPSIVARLLAKAVNGDTASFL